MLKKILIQILFFVIGAVGYPCIEMIYRSGHTHWTMILVGGLAFLTIMDVNLILKDKNILIRIWATTFMVTLIELIAGLIINKWLGMKVWDYTNIPYNICGQICLKFSFYWSLLCMAIIIVSNIIMFITKKIKTKKIKHTPNNLIETISKKDFVC